MSTQQEIQMLDFIKESNMIENIDRDPTEAEIMEVRRFLRLDKLTVDELIKFVSVYQPNAELRSRRGLDVSVGAHIPMFGGIAVVLALEELLEKINNVSENHYQCIHKLRVDNKLTAFELHAHYEHIHPFTDGNGRSGRMVWFWLMKKLNIPMISNGSVFLRTWYYYSLDYYRHVNKL